MDLAAHQRALRALLHDGLDAAAPAEDRAYFEQVAASDGLRVLRRIVAAWELYDVRRACPLTAAALRETGALEQAVEAVRFEGTGPYLESRRALFHERIAETAGGTIASVARFEQALYAVRAGDTRRHVVEWDRDPSAILGALLDSGRPADDAPRGRYRTVVSADIPGYVLVEAVRG